MSIENRFKALVAVERLVPIDPDRVAAHISRHYAAQDRKLEVLRPNASAQEAQQGSFVLAIAGLAVVAIPMPMPIPDDMLQGAIRNDIVWKDARQSFSRHRAHWLVTAMADHSAHPLAVSAAWQITLVATALSDLAVGVGAFWATAGTVISPAALQIEMRKLLQGRPPVEFWVHLAFVRRATKSGQPAHAVITTGLNPFVGREIELLPAALPPAATAAKVIGFILYLIAHGPIVKHGETIGVSETERIRVRTIEAGERLGVPIYQLEIEMLDALSYPRSSGTSQ